MPATAVLSVYRGFVRIGDADQVGGILGIDAVLLRTVDRVAAHLVEFARCPFPALSTPATPNCPHLPDVVTATGVAGWTLSFHGIAGSKAGFR